jgi:creatinine amidohydrolase
MTGPEVEEFAKTTELALLPVGCVEMHGPHLPSGSDAFVATEVCDRIATELGCIVLPAMYYNVNAMMKRFPGTISIPADVLTPLYDSIFRECARNGFSKIFAVVCHGGSETPFQFLANLVHERATPEAPRNPAQPDYYLFSKTLSMEGARRFAKT